MPQSVGNAINVIKDLLNHPMTNTLTSVVLSALFAIVVSFFTSKQTSATTTQKTISKIIQEEESLNGVIINQKAFIASQRLPTVKGKSDAFKVPAGFTGLVIMVGPGGESRKIVSIFSDGNSEIFRQEVIDSNVEEDEHMLRYVKKNYWALENVNIEGFPHPSQQYVDYALVGGIERLE